jgi:FlaA1/EpsC-like NDP-sugar epimerase/lipopolysaccharide/colanic/teichoic acid biosynthesis glycosyltransferase
MNTGKRALDLLGATVGLVLSLPLILIAAVAIKLDSSGSVFFTQRRVGRHGRVFRLYKLRSMVMQADTGSPITAGADPRVTRVGRVIRLLRLDELPQFFNVLIGDMSLVGPRPEAPPIVERYTPEQRRVLDVRPGITGLTQLAWVDEASRIPAGADPGEYYVAEILPRKLALDLQYIRTWTFSADLRILVRTPLRVVQVILGNRALVPKLGRLLIDFVAVSVATSLAFFARFDGDIPQTYVLIFVWGLPSVLAAYGSAFLYMGTYRSIWRYAGVEDFWQLGKACLLGGSLTIAIMRIANWPYPRSVLVLTPMFALLLLGGIRLTRRTLVTTRAGAAKAKRHRVVIVGAGQTGASVAREILSSPRLAYDVLGFVDDDPHLQRARLHNLPVLGTVDDLESLTRKHGLSEAIIAIPRPALTDLRRIREACVRAGLVFKTLPSLGQLVSGDGQVRYLRQVEAGDLLQRQRVSLDMETIAPLLKGKRVMVTGAGGSVGSELCRQIVRLGAQSLLMVERAENALFGINGELRTAGSRTKLTPALADIKHVVPMSELFSDFRPEIVFHTAAYKHVPILETHPAEAVLNNVIATARLANLATAHGVETFVFISTDKAVRPNNLMGATKRICEIYLMALEDPRFRIVRFGNVLGSAGSALPLFQRQIENGDPLTITDPEVSRFFMTIEEAVELVLESTTLDVQGGIAVLDMGKPIKITKLADDLVTALGLPPSLVPRQIIGLRPGEKLHEVLWDDVDEVVQCPHPRILVVRPQHRPRKEMDEFVRQLEQLAVEGHVGALLAKVQEIVPSYTGRLDNGEPRIQIEGEARKPLATGNGRSTASTGRQAAARPA